MNELRLKYIDASGSEQVVTVSSDRFSIGRHTENDLSIADSRLSRDHALIERSGNDFQVTDLGSTNGTNVNDAVVTEPVTLRDGDTIDLGGVEVSVEIKASDAEQAPPAADEPENPQPPTQPPPPLTAPAEAPPIPLSFFIIAPAIAILLLAIIGFSIFLFGGSSKKPDSSNFTYSTNRDDDPPRNRRPRDNSNSSGSSSNDIAATSPTPSADNSNSTGPGPGPTVNLSDTANTEKYGAAFLRHAAQNDPKAFITGEQGQVINAKIKSLTGSPALADNINSARKSAAQIKSLAQSKNIKPAFLVAVSLAKIGSSRGDVLQTAGPTADVLNKLSTQIGSELADDCLVVAAAYDQGAAGDFMKMRNMLQDIATKSNDSSRSIRSIWYLKKNGKITDGEFDFALRTLAIGTIMQSPHDFGVNADALTF